VVEDICFHIVDIVQNAVAAGARTVEISLRESSRDDIRTLTVRDDGRGMDRQMVANVQDPFFTTKPGKRVGLGIPLLKQTARQCLGDFRIDSAPGRGTDIRADMRPSHIDCPPVGDLVGTVVSLITSLDYLNIRFVYETDSGRFSVSTDEIREQVGDLHLSHPDVYSFLRDYIQENIDKLR